MTTLWQTSTHLDQVFESLEQHLGDAVDGIWLDRLERVELFEDIHDAIEQQSLQDSVDETINVLNRLIVFFEANEMALVRRVRTTLRQVEQDPRLQRLARAQREAVALNSQHRQKHKKDLRGQRRALLEAEFSHKCPKCNAKMNARENSRDGSTFWGCSTFRFNNPRSCQGTRPLTRIEREWMAL